MEINWKIISLPLASTFVISKGSFTHRRALVVQLGQEGCTGLGEATEISYYGISLERFEGMIQQNLIRLQAMEVTSPEEFFFKISPLFSSEPFLLCAFDCAAHDLYGQLKKKSTREILNIELRDDLPQSSFTIGIGPIEEMVEKIEQKPWPIYKIKLGTDKDLAIMKALRSKTDAKLRVDANEGWTVEQTMTLSQEFAAMDVELIEQPLPKNDDHQMTAIISKTALPIIADESCQAYRDIATCHGKFTGINIKLMKCGGLTPALHMIQKARKLGLKIMVGCMTESSIGISAAAQLVPLVDYVDLDGSLLIKEDIATGVFLRNGWTIYPEGFGLGCKLLKEHSF
ncbi:MAG: dipeptide epimerase [Saprospiraceae bacterium]|nr:dipeptide epimerase [Saprospiraceae bacterium]